MIPKKGRLTTAEVASILRSGKSMRAGAVSVRYMPASGPGKAAMVASKKVAKGAVKRNNLRRRGYRALPTPLPKVYAVFFIQKADFESADILSLCSKLS